MAFVDDPNQQDQQQVAGASPLAGGQLTDASQTQETGSTGPQGGEQIQSSGAGTPKPQIGAKGSGKASSGQYTNIQKYVQKNQPQAQKMAGAVTQDVGKQAQAIRQQAEQKHDQQQDVIDANKKALGASEDWAKEQIDAIMGRTPQKGDLTRTGVYNQPVNNRMEQQDFTQKDGTVLKAGDTYTIPILNEFGQIIGNEEVTWGGDQKRTPAPIPEFTEDQITRFQDLMAGDIAGVQDVGQLNIAEQQARANQLQQMTGRAGTEAGRRQLLGQIFQKRGDYTQGMAGLDQLITGGDQAAREALSQDVMQQGEQLGQGLGDIRQQAAQALGAQQQALQQATTGLGEEVTGLESGIQGEIDTAYEQALAQRQGLFDPESEQYQAALAGATERQQALQQALGGGKEGFAGYLLDQLTSGNLKTVYGRSDRSARNTNMIPYLAAQAGRLEDIGFQEAQAGDYFGKGKRRASYIDPLTGMSRSTWGTGLDTSHHKERMYTDRLTQDLQRQLGLGEDTADLYGIGSVANTLTRKGIDPLYRALQKQYAGIQGKTPEQLVQERLAKEAGIGFDQLAAGEDISRLETAAPEQVARVNALKQLMGSQDLISPEQYGESTRGDFTQATDLQELLGRFGG